MNRGVFSNAVDIEAYRAAEKAWYVELITSKMYWYEHVVVEHKDFPTRQAIVKELKDFKHHVEKNLEKRFIYFVASRQRIRFNTQKPPRYAIVGSKLVVHLLIGSKKRRKVVKMHLLDAQTGEICKPRVSVTPEHITFIYTPNDSVTLSVHDFLSRVPSDLGDSSEIHYVGYTKNPNSRPINGSHSGLSEILYQVPQQDRDIFIYYNLFKVSSMASSESANINFFIANAMTDEVDVEAEGALLEKILILYFDARLQKRNKEQELAELHGNLRRISEQLRIRSVTISYELEKPNPYFRFMSSKINPRDRHLFTCALDGDRPVIRNGSNVHELFGLSEA